MNISILNPILRSMSLPFFACSLGLVTSSHLYAAEGFYERGEQGWFWYQDPIEVEEPKKKEEESKKEEPKVIIMAPAEDAPTDPVEVTPKGPAPLSTAWFRENLQTYIDKAIDDPTKENVEAFYLLQRIMMDKAEDFSNASQTVVMGDPILDETTRRSTDPSSLQIQDQLSEQQRNRLLKKTFESAGLAFFFKKECDLCENQARILSYLQKRLDVEILAISIDGSTFDKGYLSDSIVFDNGQAKILDIQNGPALYLMAPPSKWIPLAHGSLSQEDIVTRVLLAAKEEGILSVDEFNKTKNKNVAPSLAKNLPKDGKLPEDTKELIKYLRGLSD